jgi:hypothetical protein
MLARDVEAAQRVLVLSENRLQLFAETSAYEQLSTSIAAWAALHALFSTTIS